jgi:hypothetical protein
MRVLRFLSALLLASVIAIGLLLAQQKLSANDAKDHVGETATVCGSVVSTRYAASINSTLRASNKTADRPR